MQGKTVATTSNIVVSAQVDEDLIVLHAANGAAQDSTACVWWQGHRKIRGQLELAFFLLYFTHKRSNFVVSIRHLPPAGKAYDVEF